jgi:ribosome-associated protein
MQLNILLRELKFKAVRSSGPGGQHVNKTSSKVELSFNLKNSEAIDELEKNRLAVKLGSKISKEGTINLQCGESRSQHRNKVIVIERLVNLLEQNLKITKARKKTKPSKSTIERRLKTKKEQALKKANRKPPKLD